MSEQAGFRIIDMPDADKEIQRIVSRHALMLFAREQCLEHDLSHEEMSTILAEVSEVYKESKE